MIVQKNSGFVPFCIFLYEKMQYENGRSLNILQFRFKPSILNPMKFDNYVFLEVNFFLYTQRKMSVDRKSVGNIHKIFKNGAKIYDLPFSMASHTCISNNYFSDCGTIMKMFDFWKFCDFSQFSLSFLIKTFSVALKCRTRLFSWN